MRLITGWILAMAWMFGQGQEQVFSLQNTSGKDLQALAVLVGTISEIPMTGVQGDETQRRLIIHSTASQLDLASWLVSHLDQPVSALPTLQKTQPKFTIPGGVVRIYFVANANSTQAIQELATNLRSLCEIRSLFTYGPLHAIVASLSPEQMRLADWLVSGLDQPAGLDAPPPPQFSISADDVARIYPVKHAGSVQTFQEMATGVRSLTLIRRLFTFNQTNTICFRGTQEQIQMAEWLLSQVDRAEPQAANATYRIPGRETTDVVEVFFVKQSLTQANFQKNVTEMRRQTQITRVFTYNPLLAVMVRGTEEQLAQAERMLIQ